EADAFHVWEEVLAALARAAAQMPVLWLVEDIHAADAQTLDLLCFLAQPLRSMRALVLLTLRPQDPHIDRPARKRLVRLIRDGLELPLGPLGAAEVGVLATRCAGQPLPAATLDELTRRTGGNPLFVVECARAWRSGKHQLVLPATVEVLVQERLELLPDRTRSLVTTASVLGDEFSASMLGAMTDALPARIIDDLAPATRAGVL